MPSWTIGASLALALLSTHQVMAAQSCIATTCGATVLQTNCPLSACNKTVTIRLASDCSYSISPGSTSGCVDAAIEGTFNGAAGSYVASTAGGRAVSGMWAVKCMSVQTDACYTVYDTALALPGTAAEAVPPAAPLPSGEPARSLLMQITAHASKLPVKHLRMQEKNLSNMFFRCCTGVTLGGI